MQEYKNRIIGQKKRNNLSRPILDTLTYTKCVCVEGGRG